MLNKLSLIISFILLNGLHSYAQNAKGEITQRADGKYVLTERGQINIIYERTYSSQHPFYVRHKKIPIGTIISIKNPKSGITIEAEVVDSMRRYRDEILSINQKGFDKLFPDGYIYTDEVELTYITPIDSLLKELEKQDDKGKMHIYTLLGNYYKDYHPEKTTEYVQKNLALATKLGDKELAAQTWLALGDAKNNAVEKTIFRRKMYDSRFKTQEEVINHVASQTKFKAEDIRRWNRYGGYIPYSRFEWAGETFELYPHPEQFSDTEYMEYLKIREAQKDTNKIAWGLKKLGDLYRLKTGYDKAEEYYLKLLKLREAYNQQEQLNWIWGYLADFYSEQNKGKESEIYLMKLYETRAKNPDIEKIIWALGGLRNLRYAENKAKEALEYQHQIFKYYQQLNNNERYRILEVVIRDYTKAFNKQKKDVLNYLIEWFQTKENTTEQEKIILAENIGQIAGSIGNFSMAAEYVYYLVPFEKNIDEKIKIINDVAFYYQKNKQYDLSLKHYKEALDYTKTNDNKILQAIQLNKIGYFYESKSDLKNADKWYKKALKLMKKEIKDASVRDGNLLKQIIRISAYFKNERKNDKLALQLTEEGKRIILNEYLWDILDMLDE